MQIQETDVRSASRRAGLVYLALVYIIWGSTYLAIRLAVQEGAGFPPFTLAALRAGVAGAVLLLWTAARHQRLRLDRHELWVLALSGGLLWIGGNGLVVWAEQKADSGYAALVVASAPLWVALLEALLDRRLPTLVLVGSLLAGLAGVALLTVPLGATSGGVDAASAGALLLAALTWGAGSILQQRRPVAVTPLVSAGYQMLFGAAGLALLALLSGEPPPTPTLQAWLAWGYLVAVGSLVGFTSYVQVLRRLPTDVVMTYADVHPVIAVILGALVLHERLSAATLGGMALVLLGVAGVFRERYRRRSR